MISFIENADIFQSQMQCLVNPVNCQGVSGAGLAKAFKLKFPKFHNLYIAACKAGSLDVGKPWIWRGPQKWVLAFATKKSWKYPSKIEYITDGLASLVMQLENWGVTSLAVPALGCGWGGLEWPVVETALIAYLGRLEIPIEIYEPYSVHPVPKVHSVHPKSP